MIQLKTNYTEDVHLTALIASLKALNQRMSCGRNVPIMAELNKHKIELEQELGHTVYELLTRKEGQE